VRLHEALGHLSAPRFTDVELNVDVKHRGFEPELIDGLRRHRLLHRTLLSSQVTAVLDRLRELEPDARTGISIGGAIARWSQRWSDWRTQVLDGLHSGRWDALMVQHKLIDPALLDAVVSRDSLLYAWTVNERDAIESLLGLGVHGITTSDPRLFGPSAG
jgi:glycerophosphoryl diester phosphodiesterase